MLTNEKNLIYLQYKYQSLTNAFNEKHLLGLFVVEKQLYTVYIPSFREVCLNLYCPRTSYDEVKIIDIRDFLDLHKNITCLAMLFSKDYILNSKYEYIFKQYFFDFAESFKNNVSEKKTKSIIEDGVVYLIELGGKETTNVDFDAFEKDLTPTEKKAYEYVKSKMIGNEVFISISQAIEETKYSRPVYNNLFAKMKEYKVAEVTSKGAKGTLIRLLP